MHDPVNRSAPSFPVVDGSTQLFAIVGDPIAQVRSPEMFNAWFRAHSCNAVLVPWHVTTDDFDDVIACSKRIANLRGLVITIPHKVAALRHADWLLPGTDAIGALNALSRQADGRWAGAMFDGTGFVAGLAAGGFAVRGWRVFMAGAGGVARSIAHALARAHIRAITFHDIDPERANALARNLAAYYPELGVEIAALPPLDCALALNATPLGMKPGDLLPIDISRLPTSTVIADVIMKPAITPLLIAARARGHPVALGRRVLEHQLELIVRFFGLA